MNVHRRNATDAGDSPSEQTVYDLIESFTNLIQAHADAFYSNFSHYSNY